MVESCPKSRLFVCPAFWSARPALLLLCFVVGFVNMRIRCSIPSHYSQFCVVPGLIDPARPTFFVAISFVMECVLKCFMVVRHVLSMSP